MFSASRNVLIVLDVRHYVYRSGECFPTAAGAFGPEELGLSQLQIGLVFSAFSWALFSRLVAGGSATGSGRAAH